MRPIAFALALLAVLDDGQTAEIWGYFQVKK
jgi:hypothetical protein